MTFFEVWSTHTDPEKAREPVDVRELRRTDRKVADNDRDIIQDILHRKSWVREANA